DPRAQARDRHHEGDWGERQGRPQSLLLRGGRDGTARRRARRPLWLGYRARDQFRYANLHAAATTGLHGAERVVRSMVADRRSHRLLDPGELDFRTVSGDEGGEVGSGAGAEIRVNRRGAETRRSFEFQVSSFKGEHSAISTQHSVLRRFVSGRSLPNIENNGCASFPLVNNAFPQICIAVPLREIPKSVITVEALGVLLHPCRL